MGDPEFIGPQLIKMLAVGETDILVQHQAVDNRQNTIHAVYGQQDDVSRIVGLQNQLPRQE